VIYKVENKERQMFLQRESQKELGVEDRKKEQ
jgi:hypothetical protein